jgi:hypothetical protein
VHDPDVVFLRRRAALDPQAHRNLWDLLSGLNDSGRTVVLTTHYMDEAEVLCDRVAIMDKSRILQCDSPAALIRGLDAPARITVAPGQVHVDEARGYDGVDEASGSHEGVVLTTRNGLARLGGRDECGLRCRRHPAGVAAVPADPSRPGRWSAPGSVTVAIALVQLVIFVGIAAAAFGLTLTGSWWMSVPLLVVGTLCLCRSGCSPARSRRPPRGR